jgi:hypothetical protein
VHTICPDWMHCKHLGFDQYLYGSVASILCRDIMPGSFVANVNALSDELSAEYVRLGVRSRLTVTSTDVITRQMSGLFRPFAHQTIALCSLQCNSSEDWCAESQHV